MEFQEVIEVDEKLRTDDVKTNGSFESLMISPSIVENLRKHGYRVPSPVQMKAIPTGLAGLDMLVQAKSGTGKTLVFSILAVENLNLQSDATQKIIIAPTREIATQIKDTIKLIAHFKTRIGVLVGGTPVHLDVQALKRGVHIIIGTTGRICQMVQNGNLSLRDIDLFILDEADKLMEECFQKDINYLFSALPPSRQVAVFSATYPKNLDQLLCKFMREASLIRLNSDDVQLIGIKQYAVIYDGAVLDCLVRLLNLLHFNQALVFCNLHQQCEPTQVHLEISGFLTASISAQISQRERDSVIERLKQNKLKVLVSTDLTARGIDATNVNLVVNLETAINAETYFHRIGRAARYGGYGAAVTILADTREIGRFKAMVTKGGINVRLMSLNDCPPDLTTNQTYFESCPVFSVTQVNAKDLHLRESSKFDDQGKDVPKILSGTCKTIITPSKNQATYDHRTMLELSRSTCELSKEMKDRINEIGISRNDKPSIASSFVNEAVALTRQISKLKKIDNFPEQDLAVVRKEISKKYKFTPSRDKAKKKFYLRGELLSIRDAVPKEVWTKLASSKFDMSQEPFTGDTKSADVVERSNKNIHKRSESKPRQQEENCPAVKRYSRKDMIAIQNSVQKKIWLPYVKARWDTTQEPFQLNQYLRCPFEEQLRRRREIEKRQRAEVMKTRLKAQTERPKLMAFSRTGWCGPVEETSFESFCSRVKMQFDQQCLSKCGDYGGAVIPVRDPPDIWKGKVAYYTNWLRNFDEVFKYGIDKDRGWKCEVSIGADEGQLLVGHTHSEEDFSETTANADNISKELPIKNDDPTVEEDEVSKKHIISCHAKEDSTETHKSSLEELETSAYHSCCSGSHPSDNEDTDVERSDDRESVAVDEHGSEGDFLGDGEEELLRRFVDEYKKNVDFSCVFSSYMWMLNRKYRRN